MQRARFRDPTLVVTALALLALPVLAWMQVRSLSDVSTMARDRLDRAARNAAAGVARDLEAELGRLIPWGSTSIARAASSSAPSHDVFVVDAPGAALRFREWSIDERVCRDRDWPGDLAAVRDAAARHFGTLPRPRAVTLASALDRVTPTHIVFGVPLAGGSASPRTLAPPCSTDEDAVLVIRVDLDWVRSSLLPMLVERHFGDAGSSEFNVAVVAREGPEVIAAIPASDVAWTRMAATDVSAPLFILRADEPGTPDAPGDDDRDDHDGPHDAEVAGAAAGRMIARKAPWTLVAQHRLGSLDAAVARVTRRNLVLALGVLLTLAAAVVAIAVSARRATRLSAQQLEFVAAVSHELRSPVTAIDLAAQNIEAGVVADGERLRKYGATIRVEARRLGATVERVLQFASINGGQSALSRVPVGVAALVERVVARARLQFRGAAIHVSCAIPDTASVIGDQASLESCVENLVANAVRHGGPASDVRIDARLDDTAGAPRVLLRVEDDGAGVAPGDRAHLFEPFFRGARAIERRLPGNGLGLYVVKHLVEAHGGTVQLDTARRSGAAFTLSLPLASPTAGSGAGQSAGEAGS